MDTYKIYLYHTGTIFQTVDVEADDFITVNNKKYIVFSKNENNVEVFNLENIFGFQKLDT